MEMTASEQRLEDLHYAMFDDDHGMKPRMSAIEHDVKSLVAFKSWIVGLIATSLIGMLFTAASCITALYIAFNGPAAQALKAAQVVASDAVRAAAVVAEDATKAAAKVEAAANE